MKFSVFNFAISAAVLSFILNSYAYAIGDGFNGNCVNCGKAPEQNTSSAVVGTSNAWNLIFPPSKNQDPEIKIQPDPMAGVSWEYLPLKATLDPLTAQINANFLLMKNMPVRFPTASIPASLLPLGFTDYESFMSAQSAFAGQFFLM